MSPESYQSRVVDGELISKLESAGAVLIEGPKACGKTETARQVAASEVRLDIDSAARDAIQVAPNIVLDGAVPRLIDEWQVEPAIWNHVRHAVDDRKERGQFILTGSASPTDDDTRHSGGMRFGRLRMRPMSLCEAGVSTGRISLEQLLDGDFNDSADPGVTVPDLAEEIARGGWPATRDLDERAAREATRDYLDQIRRTDINSVDGKRRDPEKLGQLLRSLARNVATHVAVSTLAADVGGDGDGIKAQTAAEYLDALVRLFVVENQPAWAPHLRSRHQLRKADKRHFVDPSLAVAALRTSSEALLRDLHLLGLLFESLVVRDLRVYSQPLEGEVKQFRNNVGQEVDAIVTTPAGAWAAFEIKLGGSGLIDEAAESLKRFLEQIDTTKCGKPAAVGVVVGTGYGYVRPDGIQVIPIGALGP